MRIVVSYEEHTSDIPMILLKDSLKWDEGAFYPVTWGNDFSSVKNLLGSVSEVRREDDGAITCEFTPNGQFVLLEKDIWATASATIFASQVVEQKHDGMRVVHSCQLASIFFGIGVPWNSKLEG